MQLARVILWMTGALLSFCVMAISIRTLWGTLSIMEILSLRAMIGLVPQELTTDAFETVWATCTFSRGLFGKPHNPAFVEKVLKDVSLWDKKDQKIMTLSGGMKRRVLIAKANAQQMIVPMATP